MQSSNERPAVASGTFMIGDRSVYRLGFGAMRITGYGIWGPPADHDEAIRVLRHTLDLGINLIDTADAYGPDVSEELIAEALYPYPEGVVIATKGGLVRGGPNEWSSDGRPEHLREALEGSLRRLRVDQIELYQFHRPDPQVAFEDSVGEIAKMQAEGKIRHVGLSNVTADELARAQAIVPIVSVQNHFNLERPMSERMDAQQAGELIDICARQGIGFIPWHPLAVGDLAAPGAIIDQVAKRHEATPGQIALAWLLQRSTTMLPIPGTSTVAHLDENAQGATITLSQEDFDAIRQAAQA